MKSLVTTRELKTNRWVRGHENDVVTRPPLYDGALDAMLLYIEFPKDRIITHRIDDYISLLYRHADKELIGIRIDKFFSEFIRNFKEWRLSNTGKKLSGIDEFDICLEFGKDFVAVITEIAESTSQSTLPKMDANIKSKIEFDKIPLSEPANAQI
jgi:hypothetical protein